MKKIKKITEGIESLIVFSELKTDPVFKSLYNFAEAAAKKSRNTLAIYSSLLSKLFPHSSSLAEYAKQLLIKSENFYIKGVCTGRIFDKNIEEALKNDLSILSEIVSIDPRDILDNAGVKCAQSYKAESVDFVSFYCDRIENIEKCGYGEFAINNVFTYDGKLRAIQNPDPQRLSELKGYERERGMAVDNTLSFINGGAANNMLLYGDAGTGKSSTIKAILNEYADRGLRLIEIKKEFLHVIPNLLTKLYANPLKFILFIDDLSFSKNDDNFSALKAVLEGSVVGTGNNCIVYATSNRRHLVRESMEDRAGDDIHLYDTMQESLSLSARFGLTVTFQKPDKDDYLKVVLYYATVYNLEMEKELLEKRAESFAIRNGGRSPRCAKQFVRYELAARG